MDNALHRRSWLSSRSARKQGCSSAGDALSDALMRAKRGWQMTRLGALWLSHFRQISISDADRIRLSARGYIAEREWCNVTSYEHGARRRRRRRSRHHGPGAAPLTGGRKKKLTQITVIIKAHNVQYYIVESGWLASVYGSALLLRNGVLQQIVSFCWKLKNGTYRP